jgi:hypothetical protein
MTTLNSDCNNRHPLLTSLIAKKFATIFEPRKMFIISNIRPLATKIILERFQCLFVFLKNVHHIFMCSSKQTHKVLNC